MGLSLQRIKILEAPAPFLLFLWLKSKKSMDLLLDSEKMAYFNKPFFKLR